MPKVFLTSAKREEARAKEADDAFRTMVAARLMRKEINRRELSERIKMSQPTLTRRLAHPEMLTIGELRRIALVLELKPEEIHKCI